MQWLFAHYVGNQPTAAANPYAFPLRAKELSKLPPAAVITADIDPLRDDGKGYADALQKAG